MVSSTAIHSPGGHRLREPQSWLPRAWRICSLVLFVVVLVQSVVLLAALGQIGELAAQARAQSACNAELETVNASARQCAEERERLVGTALEMAKRCSRRATVWDSVDAR
jgi:hypothetical protein